MTHPLTGQPDEVVALIRRISELDGLIAAAYLELDDLGRLVAAVVPGIRVPWTLSARVRFTVDRIDGLRRARAETIRVLESRATVAETVPVRVLSDDTLTQPERDPDSWPNNSTP